MRAETLTFKSIMLYRKLETNKGMLKCNQMAMDKIPVSTKMQTGDWPWVQNSDQVRNAD